MPRMNETVHGKRKTAGSREHALSPKLKKNPKKYKPEFVGGIPVTPISGPAVLNEYHYDPMNEMTPLGRGQLRSAYRKCKFNIEPPKQTKMYKLEHKDSTEKELLEEKSKHHSPEPFLSEGALPCAAGTCSIPDSMSPAPSMQPMTNFSPNSLRLENERRFSMGSSDRTRNGGAIPIREHTTSLQMTRNLASFENFHLNHAAKGDKHGSFPQRGSCHH